jgi:hypothetical protein
MPAMAAESTSLNLEQPMNLSKAIRMLVLAARCRHARPQQQQQLNEAAKVL